MVKGNQIVFLFKLKIWYKYWFIICVFGISLHDY